MMGHSLGSRGGRLVRLCGHEKSLFEQGLKGSFEYNRVATIFLPPTTFAPLGFIICMRYRMVTAASIDS